MSWKRVITLPKKIQKPLTKNQAIERKNLYFYSSVLLKELEIDNTTKQDILFSMFSKWSRKQLTIDELEHFVSMLEQMRNNGNKEDA